MLPKLVILLEEISIRAIYITITIALRSLTEPNIPRTLVTVYSRILFPCQDWWSECLLPALHEDSTVDNVATEPQ